MTREEWIDLAVLVCYVLGSVCAALPIWYGGR